MTESGTIKVAMVSSMIEPRPRNWYFASANAAMELITSVIRVATMVTNTEFWK